MSRFISSVFAIALLTPGIAIADEGMDRWHEFNGAGVFGGFAEEVEPTSAVPSVGDRHIDVLLHRIDKRNQRRARRHSVEFARQRVRPEKSQSTVTAKVIEPVDRFAYPLPERVRVSSTYGDRLHPISGQRSFHEGLDLAAPTGTPVLAAKAGRVVEANHKGGLGKQVTLLHSENEKTRYAHLSKWIVKPGDVVHKGDAIGYVGSTGNSTGPHLHFEVWSKVGTQWSSRDPQAYFNDRAIAAAP